MILLASFQLAFIGLSVGHHDPKMIHEGDEIENFDFGVHQIHIVFERSQAKPNVFVSLTTFGDHLMHHVFPSLDHALLPQMSEVFLETCKEFKIEIKNISLWDGFWGQIKQMKRTEKSETLKTIKVESM